MGLAPQGFAGQTHLKEQREEAEPAQKQGAGRCSGGAPSSGAEAALFGWLQGQLPLVLCGAAAAPAGFS